MVAEAREAARTFIDQLDLEDVMRREGIPAFTLESHRPVWAFDVLATLRRQGAPFRLTPGQLSAATMLTMP